MPRITDPAKKAALQSAVLGNSEVEGVIRPSRAGRGTTLELAHIGTQDHGHHAQVTATVRPNSRVT
jgi:hypothetical protein